MPEYGMVTPKRSSYSSRIESARNLPSDTPTLPKVIITAVPLSSGDRIPDTIALMKLGSFNKREAFSGGPTTA